MNTKDRNINKKDKHNTRQNWQKLFKEAEKQHNPDNVELIQNEFDKKEWAW